MKKHNSTIPCEAHTMPLTRRDWTMLLPALLGAPIASAAPERKLLPAATYKFEDLPVKKTGENFGREVFDGLTHSGLQVDIHETELAPGSAPHAAHRHIHEEIVMVRQGTLEVTIEGKVSTIPPGGVVYVASNDFHGWKNVGSTRAHYFVFALGREA
jgi:quercetin dioxygenase-like cupin family protein